MYLLAGNKSIFNGDIFECIHRLKRGIISVVVGYREKVIAVAAIVGRDYCRRLFAVRTAGVHMQIAHERIAPGKILKKGIYAQAHNALSVEHDVDKMLLLTLICVRKAQTAVRTGSQLIFGAVVTFRVIVERALIKLLDGYQIFLPCDERNVGAQRSYADLDRLAAAEHLRKNVIIEKFRFHFNHLI